MKRARLCVCRVANPIPRAAGPLAALLSAGGELRIRSSTPRRRSGAGARHWAIVASLVATAKLNGVEPLAWLTDVLERVVSGRTKAHELARLLPWAWKAERLAVAPEA